MNERLRRRTERVGKCIHTLNLSFNIYWICNKCCKDTHTHTHTLDSKQQTVEKAVKTVDNKSTWHMESSVLAACKCHSYSHKITLSVNAVQCPCSVFNSSFCAVLIWHQLFGAKEI